MALVVMLILIFALGGFIFYQRITWPKPQYFATTPDGQPIPVVPLNFPYYEDPNLVLKWASKAVIAIYSLDYVNWRAILQDAEDYFTTKGYQDFLKALKASTNLEAIKSKKATVSITVTGDPKLTRQGQLSPEVPYSWDIQLPVTLVYQNSINEVVNQVGIILMQVERASLLRYKEGMAIAQLVLQAQ